MFEVVTHRRSARHMLAAALRRQNEQDRKATAKVAQHFNDGAMLLVQKTKPRSVYSGLHADGPVRFGDDVHKIRMGPNEVHAFITHPDGDIEDLGISLNLLTNIGRDVFHGWIGGFIPAGGAGSPATAVGASSVTATGTPWTASNLGTPQLGLAGFRIYMPVTGLTTPPVYGNVVSNTNAVAAIDQWWTAADDVGTTPANTNAFIIGAGGIASVRFMALTTNAGAASASDTTLTGEITSGGCGRALATYAHTMGQATDTLQKAFSVTSTFTAIHKMGLFCCFTAAGADPMIFETVLNVDATVVNGDTLTVTDTITVSG